MRGPLNDEVRIRHVLDAIVEVERYLTGVSLDDFLSNSEKRFATIKQIEIIGEARFAGPVFSPSPPLIFLLARRVERPPSGWNSQNTTCPSWLWQ
ncbi:HepT-like ribonuclease domain-containing protein [Compostibacter hankyongensis]|uniref:HepT-like ribonuclease domain-containing protein n=1 Tax=Compostibacter hankyongensis TaxID=1007089 RepID=UPI003CD06572